LHRREKAWVASFRAVPPRKGAPLRPKDFYDDEQQRRECGQLDNERFPSAKKVTVESHALTFPKGKEACVPMSNWRSVFDKPSARG